MTEDSMHRTLNAALARNSGPSAEDVEARPIVEEFAVVVAALLAGRIDGHQAVASLAAIHTRILAAHTAAAEARGAGRGARAVVEAVEETFLGQLPSKALSYCAQEDVNAGLDALVEQFGLDGDPR
jgi:hypothetical protein